jgi:hypothetical protein
MKIRIMIAVAALAVVAGCGGEDTTTTTGPSVTGAPAATTTQATTPAAPTVEPTTPESTPVDTRCHTSELSASFSEGDAAAGNRYSTLTLTNKAGRTCTVYGYGGLQPLDTAKKELPVTLARNGAQGGPELVTLAPGKGVSRTIHWTAVPTGSATCPTGSYAEIIPPDETDPLVVPFAFGEICGGTMDGTPFGVTL